MRELAAMIRGVRIDLRMWLVAASLLAPFCPRTVRAQPLQLRHRPEHAAAIQRFFEDTEAEWLALYRRFHQHPELSLHERQTAARIADRLQRAGIAVTRAVGGHGVVGVLKNGPGRTLLLRGDMDALPIAEETGLPYASRVRVRDNSGTMVGVMHACGHDIHMTNLLATAAFLARHRDAWSGTLLVVAQPAEELGEGALRMIEDGLFKRFPLPDFAIALHVTPDLPAGRVGYTAGWAAANVDSVDITVHGQSGHGARPHQANDPVVTASHLVLALQTLVSRRTDPQAAAVITVGVLRAGTKRNIIPDHALLQLTVRSYSDEVRDLLLRGIREKAEGICNVYGCPKRPEIRTKETYTPAVYNDPELTQAAARIFAATLGKEAVRALPPSMGGEDFGRYARHLQVPGLLFRLGSAPRAEADSRKPGGRPLPSLHASGFAPDPGPTLRTGLFATAALALALLPPPG